ncbi:MAG: methyl-accepting chemotaxis protein [Thermodesulfobacteriota bacterium]
MEFRLLRNSKMGIAIKTAIAVGVMILILLTINGVIFLRLESSLVSQILNEYVQKVDKAIDQQGEKQRQGLKENLANHALVLGNAVATFIYNLDKSSLEQMLSAYIKLPELKAVEVFDENGEPFFAIWKNPGIQIKRTVPDDVPLDESLMGGADAFLKEEKVGSVKIYFTDELIKAQMEGSKQLAQSDINAFKTTVDGKFNQAVWIQGGIILLVVMLLVTAIVLAMNVLAIKGIRMVAEGARRFSVGDIALEGMNMEEIAKINARGDELGDTGRAFSQLIEYMKEKTLAAAEIAKGNLDLDVAIKSDADQLGTALNQMVESLNQVISELYLAAEQVDGGSNQVSESSQSLSQGATEQASSLEEISSSMTEIGSQTKTNAENATHANQLATSAKGVSLSGVQQMQEMTRAMDAITQSSKEIAKIIKAIDDIAFQTNLLALNAAVEAARAGKHGKGFAVVAQEVRTLAARSAKAAQETAELIDAAIRNVDNGSGIVQKTARALNSINDEITKVTDLVGEIAAASSEQAQRITQVSKGLSQIDSVTQQNTANAEETSAAAQELSSQAAHVRNLLGRFRLRRRSQPSASTTRPEPPPSRQAVVRRIEDSEWGAPAGGADKGRIVAPQEIIALDDDEFGKY